MRTTEVRHDNYWVVDHAEDCPILEVVEMQDGVAEDTKYEDALGDIVQFCLDGNHFKRCHYCGADARFEKDEE